MLKELLHIGPVTIYGYGLMIAIGVVTCVLVGMKRAKSYGVNPDRLFNAAFIGIIFGIIGAKVNFWLTDLPNIIANPKSLLDLNGGFVVYGGLVLGVASAMLYLKIKKEPAMKYIDIAAPSIALAQGFGRIGCFLAGCCYGKIAPDGAWYAVHFPHGVEAPEAIGLFPTQLLSAGFNFLLCVFLCYQTRRALFRGEIISLYMIIYSVARFWIECIREEPTTVGIFTTAQFTAFFILAAGLILFFFMKKKALSPLRKGGAAGTDTLAEKEEKPEKEAEADAPSDDPAEEEASPADEAPEAGKTGTGNPDWDLDRVFEDKEEAAEETLDIAPDTADEIIEDAEEAPEETAAEPEETMTEE